MKDITAIGLMILLIPCTVTDIRTKTLPVLFILLFGAAAAAFNRITGSQTWIQMLAGLVPGAFLLAAAVISKEKIGFGDGILFLAIGVFCGSGMTASLLFLSLLLSLVIGGAGLLIRKKPKDTAFPFVPFVTAAALVLYFAGRL